MTLTVVALLSGPVLPGEPTTALSLCQRYFYHHSTATITVAPFEMCAKFLFFFNIDILRLSVHYNSNQGPCIHESKEFAQSRTQKLQEMSGKSLSSLSGGFGKSKLALLTTWIANQDMLCVEIFLII